jgi:hypothetical protein
MGVKSSTGRPPGQGEGCIRHETGLPAPEPEPAPVAVVATEALGEWRDPAAAAAAIATAVAAAVAVAAPITGSPKRAWRMPVVAEEEATCRGPKRNRRNDWHRSHGPRARHVTAAPLLVPGEDRESRVTLSTRTRASAKPDARSTRNGCRASAGRPAGEGRPILFQRCPAPARAIRRTIGAHRRDVPLLENVLLTPRSRVGTFSRGAPPGMASRRNARQPPSRPSRRPEVADITRAGRTLHATAGRRAGAEARPAPNATAGR